MKRRRNAPISPADMRALKRVWSSHRGKGNMKGCPRRNPKRGKRSRRDEILDRRAPGAQWTGAMARAQRKHHEAQKRRNRHSRKSRRGRFLSRQSRKTFDRIRSLAGPGRISRRNPKRESWSKLRRADQNMWHNQLSWSKQKSGAHKGARTKWKKWQKARRRAERRLDRDAKSRSSRSNPKRGRKSRRYRHRIAEVRRFGRDGKPYTLSRRAQRRARRR